MQASRSTRGKTRAQSARGFAFSLDAVFSIVILAASAFLLVSIQDQKELGAAQSTTVVEDTLFALEGSGYIVQTIDTNSPTQAAGLIRQELLSYLPTGFDANVSVISYAASGATCAAQKTFAACFPDSNKLVGKSGSSAASSFVSGKKFFLRKQPPGDCNLSYASFEAFGNEKSVVDKTAKTNVRGRSEVIAYFAADANITFDVNVSPAGSFSCDQNVFVTIKASTNQSFRKKIDMILILDLSGNVLGQEKTTAKNFIDKALWLDQDQTGLVSYSTNGKKEHPVTNNRASLKNKVDTLKEKEGNEIDDGIKEANEEIQPQPSGHGRSDASKFFILLADGTGNEEDVNAKAQEAKGLGAKIFTVGYGQSVNEGLLKGISQITGGEYYHADSNASLQAVYDIIANRISTLATDSNVFVPVMSGVALVDLNGGKLQDGNLLFNSGSITPQTPWVATYIINFPCTSQGVCGQSSFTFPGSGSTFKYIDQDGVVHSQDFNASSTLGFKTRDLDVKVTAGSVQGTDNITLDTRVKNVGDLNTTATKLRFRLNDTNGQVLASYNVPPLCSSKDANCSNHTANYNSVGINKEGVIYATVNDDNSMSECPLGNYYGINCYGSPATQVFVVEYFAWRA